MKSIAKISLIALLAIAPAALRAQQDTRAFVTQDAKAERLVTPDELYLSITINEKDNKGKSTIEEMQSKMVRTLQSQGIDVEKNLSLNYMGSEISYSAFKRNVTPRTTATYTLKLNRAELMQKVIEQLEKESITNISLTRTAYSKADELYNELGAEAMKKAQAQAANLAAAVGQNIGSAININSWNSSNAGAQPRLYKARGSLDYAVANESAVAEEPQIEIGKITFSVNVTVKFLLNEK